MLLTVKIILLGLILIAYSLLNAFSIALSQLSEAQTSELAEQGDKKASKLLKFIENDKAELDRISALKFFSALLFSGYSVLAFHRDMRHWLFDLFLPKNLTVQVILNFIGGFVIIILAALVLYIFGEIVARISALKRPEATSRNLLGMVSLSIAIVKPIAVVVEAFWQKISNAFGTNPDYDEEVTEEEILQMVDDAEESGVLEESQKELINNIFEFDDTPVSEVMNHRTDIFAVDVSDKLEDVLKIAIEEGFSRIPVYEEDLDNIIGLIYVKDLLKYVGKKLPERVSLRSIMREAYHIPRTKRCSELFEEFTEKRIQMAIVIDEYGGTAGLITLEDLMEEIFGNIQDEYDDEEEDIEQLSENVFTIDGVTDIEEVSERLGRTLL
ncbi:MAG: HlyC/CorC family transporter [Clostridia bacterium]|nr:HlyC/CorC family transporter [Clostridia bacterium]